MNWTFFRSDFNVGRKKIKTNIPNLTLNSSFNALSKWGDPHIKKPFFSFWEFGIPSYLPCGVWINTKGLNPGLTRYSFIVTKSDSLNFENNSSILNIFYKMSVIKACAKTKCFSFIRTNIEIFCLFDKIDCMYIHMNIFLVKNNLYFLLQSDQQEITNLLNCLGIWWQKCKYIPFCFKRPWLVCWSSKQKKYNIYIWTLSS